MFVKFHTILLIIGKSDEKEQYFAASTMRELTDGASQPMLVKGTRLGAMDANVDFTLVFIV